MIESDYKTLGLEREPLRKLWGTGLNTKSRVSKKTGQTVIKQYNWRKYYKRVPKENPEKSGPKFKNKGLAIKMINDDEEKNKKIFNYIYNNFDVKNDYVENRKKALEETEHRNAHYNYPLLIKRCIKMLNNEDNGKVIEFINTV